MNGGNFCNVLFCGVNNNPLSCTSFALSSGNNVRVANGVSCGTSSQCVNQTCVPSNTIDPVRTFSFQAGPFSTCSATCNGGTQTRTVV